MGNTVQKQEVGPYVALGSSIEAAEPPDIESGHSGDTDAPKPTYGTTSEESNPRVAVTAGSSEEERIEAGQLLSPSAQLLRTDMVRGWTYYAPQVYRLLGCLTVALFVAIVVLHMFNVARRENLDHRKHRIGIGLDLMDVTNNHFIESRGGASLFPYLGATDTDIKAGRHHTSSPIWDHLDPFMMHIPQKRRSGGGHYSHYTTTANEDEVADLKDGNCGLNSIIDYDPHRVLHQAGEVAPPYNDAGISLEVASQVEELCDADNEQRSIGDDGKRGVLHTQYPDDWYDQHIHDQHSATGALTSNQHAYSEDTHPHTPTLGARPDPVGRHVLPPHLSHTHHDSGEHTHEGPYSEERRLEEEKEGKEGGGLVEEGHEFKDLHAEGEEGEEDSEWVHEAEEGVDGEWEEYEEDGGGEWFEEEEETEEEL